VAVGVGVGVVGAARARGGVQRARVRHAEERLTFLGARREEPCEERTEEASSVMALVVQAVQRRCRCSRTERAGASSCLAAALVMESTLERFRQPWHATGGGDLSRRLQAAAGPGRRYIRLLELREQQPSGRNMQ
jgi:hypothetical protein